MDNTFISDRERAQAIINAIQDVVAAVEADNVARTGRGGPVQVVANVTNSIQFQAWQIAQAFDLPWDGPDFGGTSTSTVIEAE